MDIDSKVEVIAMHLIDLVNAAPDADAGVRVPVDYDGNPIFDSPRPGLYTFPIEYVSRGEKHTATVTVGEPSSPPESKGGEP